MTDGIEELCFMEYKLQIAIMMPIKKEDNKNPTLLASQGRIVVAPLVLYRVWSGQFSLAPADTPGEHLALHRITQTPQHPDPNEC